MPAKKITIAPVSTLKEYGDEIVSELVARYSDEIADESSELDTRMRAFHVVARDLATWKDQIYDGTMSQLRDLLPPKNKS